MDLQPLQNSPLDRKGKKERSRHRYESDPTDKFDYSQHISSNSKMPSKRNPANGCIKY